MAGKVRRTNATLLRSRMNGNVHVRFWSRAGMATFRLRQRRQVMGMTPDREVGRMPNAETILGLIREDLS
jgi:hypothetical protein